MADNVLEIRDLKVSFDTYAGEVHAVRGVSFDVANGEVLAIVGESGCGKSVTAQTIMKLNPMPPARIKQGSIMLDGRDIVAMTEKQMQAIRGSLVSMIFQDPMTSLNPTKVIGKQLTEAIIVHSKLSDEEAREGAEKLLRFLEPIPEKERVDKLSEYLERHTRNDEASAKRIAEDLVRAASSASGEEQKRQVASALVNNAKIDSKKAQEEAIRLLKLVQIPNAEERVKQYPHEFSGGMRQRVMIAMALSCSPRLLIADEPTTALDVTIQAQIMDLMADIKEKIGTSIILITHDLGVVANLADRVAVMYAGKIVERGKVDDIFYHPAHPYTMGLLESLPRLDSDRAQELTAINGTPPDLFAPPEGCEFADRCKHCMKICKKELPPLIEVGEGHSATCWLLSPAYKAAKEKGGKAQ